MAEREERGRVRTAMKRRGLEPRSLYHGKQLGVFYSERRYGTGIINGAPRWFEDVRTRADAILGIK